MAQQEALTIRESLGYQEGKTNKSKVFGDCAWSTVWMTNHQRANVVSQTGCPAVVPSTATWGQNVRGAAVGVLTSSIRPDKSREIRTLDTSIKQAGEQAMWVLLMSV